MPDPMEIVTAEELADAMAAAGELKIRWPKDTDSPRGPSIEKKEMTRYLVSLFSGFKGKWVAESDLLNAIKKACNLRPVTPVLLPQTGGGGDPGGAFDRAAQEGMHAFVCSEHRVTAKAIFNAFTKDIRNVFYWRRLKGLDVKAAAKKMACSAGTVSEKDKRITSKAVEIYLQNSLGQPNFEEINAVMDLVGLMVLNEEEPS